MKLRKGLEILEDIPGIGEEIQKLHSYRMKFQMWLNKGGPVVWHDNIPNQFQEFTKLSRGRTVLTEVHRYHRENFIPGIYYGIKGMRVHGTRRLKIAPNLAYGEKGVDGIIPPNALLIVEITVLEEYDWSK